MNRIDSFTVLTVFSWRNLDHQADRKTMNRLRDQIIYVDTFARLLSFLNVLLSVYQAFLHKKPSLK